MLLLTILALSIVVCTLNRAPAIWQNFRHPLLRRSDKFYLNALERAEFTHDNAVEWTRAALRKRHYRVRGVVEMTEEVTYLYANKNSWATLCTFVFHAALVTLLLAVSLSRRDSVFSHSPARRFFSAPLLNLTGKLAGITFLPARADGKIARQRLLGTARYARV